MSINRGLYVTRKVRIRNRRVAEVLFVPFRTRSLKRKDLSASGFSLTTGCGRRPSSLGTPAPLPAHFRTGRWEDRGKRLGDVGAVGSMLDRPLHRSPYAAGISQLINHGTPNRSVTLPNRSAQKVSAMGICTLPCSARALKTRSASALSFGLSITAKMCCF